jgi:hypothetical protein|tara:strand:+ start:12194 stop:12370 length:177 start_codon:yes stop_codon:yes gene_type:complete
MGFNKRYITKDLILKTDSDRIDKLFSADMFIIDEWSSKFMEYYEKGMNKDEILEIIEK